MAKQHNLTLPDDFIQFVRSPQLRDRLISCTDCYLELSDRLIGSPNKDGGYLIRFLSDSQNILQWYLYISANNAPFVVASLPEWLDEIDDNFTYSETGDETLDDVIIPKDITYCAETFESFIYRFWIENSLWFTLQDKQPLTEEEQKYIDARGSFRFAPKPKLARYDIAPAIKRHSSISHAPTMHMKSLDKILLKISIICGAIYLLAPLIFGDQLERFWLPNAIIKTLSIALLSIIAFRHNFLLLGFALLLGSIGDLFLALPFGLFVYGLAAFLVGHLVYIALWVRHWKNPLQLSFNQKLISVSLFFFTLFMLNYLLPLEGGLTIPVAVYMIVITAMAMTAVLAGFSCNWIFIGAILFVISDTLIAVGRFKHLVTGLTSGFLIWATYYAAQFLITMGYFHTRSNDIKN